MVAFLGSGGELGDFGGGEGELGGVHRVLDACWAGRARNRDDDRGERQFPRQRDLLRADVVVGGDRCERFVTLSKTAGVSDAAQRAPWQEGDAERGTVLEFGQGRAEGGGELVLHRDQSAAEDLVGLVDLGHAGVGDAGELDQTLVEQVADRPRSTRRRAPWGPDDGTGRARSPRHPGASRRPSPPP